MRETGCLADAPTRSPSLHELQGDVACRRASGRSRSYQAEECKNSTAMIHFGQLSVNSNSPRAAATNITRIFKLCRSTLISRSSSRWKTAPVPVVGNKYKSPSDRDTSLRRRSPSPVCFKSTLSPLIHLYRVWRATREISNPLLALSLRRGKPAPMAPGIVAAVQNRTDHSRAISSPDNRPAKFSPAVSGYLVRVLNRARFPTNGPVIPSQPLRIAWP